MTYKVLANDIIIDMIIIYTGIPCRVVDIHRGSRLEIGFSLLQRGRTKPKMFTMTALPAEPLQVSLKYLLKKL